MPQPPTLKIVEIFASLQGEGLRQGEPTIFIRLAGCNLRCRFCDTRRAWTGGREMDVADILAAVKRERRRLGARWVDLTGGEPLLQEIGPLAAALRRGGWRIQVETNARLFRRLAVDWYSISPKPPDYGFREEYRTRAREVKLVVSPGLTAAAVAKIRAAFPPSVPVLLQLESNSRASRKRALHLLERAPAAGWPNVRLAVQLHKIIGCP